VLVEGRTPLTLKRVSKEAWSKSMNMALLAFNGNGSHYSDKVRIILIWDK